MYNIAIDTHVHSIFSGHAYCTYKELWAEAAESGLSGFGVTDHMGSLSTITGGGEINAQVLFAQYDHIICQNLNPRIINEVKIYHSVEIDIARKDGSLFGQYIVNDFFGSKNGDMTDVFLDHVDYAVASVHMLDEYPHRLTKNEGTAMYIKAMQHPKVFILGHITKNGVTFEADEVIKAAKDMGKAIELNEASCKNDQASCRDIAIRCAKIGAMVAVGSDAHGIGAIGRFPHALKLLEEISFPPELIVNGDVERFEMAIKFQSII